MSRSRGGARSQRARHNQVAELGGEATVILHAHRLASRAWPLLFHYVPANIGTYIEHARTNPPRTVASDQPDISGLSLTDALVARMDLDSLHRAPSGPLPIAAGALLDLPSDSEVDDPSGQQADPLVVDMALAVAATLPAVCLALTDDTVPVELGEGDTQHARRALVNLHRRYRHADPEYDTGGRQRVERMLLTDWDVAEACPIEITDRWQYLGRVSIEGMGGEWGAAEDMPIQCFEALHDAKRWAILQSDWSRSVAGAQRTSEFKQMIQEIADCGPDGVRALAADGSVAAQETIIEPKLTGHVDTALPGR